VTHRRSAAKARSLCLAAAVFHFSATARADDGVVERGAYLFATAGCLACHSQPKGGAPLAGGHAFETPFGTFISPNITPDPEHGLGSWSEADFVRAMREGRAPDGSAYYPVFPFTSYTGMTDADLTALWAYLKSVEPVAQPNQAHEVSFPFTTRWPALAWQWLFFEPAAFTPDPDKGEAWNRGAYLTRHLGHCGECHTPRNRFGVMDEARYLAGNPAGPDGKKVPNITPDDKTGLGGWAQIDMTYFLETGFLPDGDFTGGAMEEVVENTTSKLTKEDAGAMAEYLLSVPAIEGP